MTSVEQKFDAWVNENRHNVNTEVNLAAVMTGHMSHNLAARNLYVWLEKAFLAGMIWQPIATAPKDGTRILVRCSHGVYAVEWINQDVTWWHVDDNKHGPYPLRGAAPTLWMEIPE